MKKFLAISTALVVSLSATQAFAGGWGKSGYGISSGLVNVSPNINLGGVNALNGIGVLSGIGLNILGPNKSGGHGHHRKRR